MLVSLIFSSSKDSPWVSECLLPPSTPRPSKSPVSTPFPSSHSSKSFLSIRSRHVLQMSVSDTRPISHAYSAIWTRDLPYLSQILLYSFGFVHRLSVRLGERSEASGTH